MTTWEGRRTRSRSSGTGSGPVVATSVHAGHGLRPEIAEAMVLDEAERFREEDPFTDRIAAVVPDRVVTTRSRFEADLNRPRREAVYRSPEDCWGLDVWRDGVLSDELFEGSLATYDAFYDALAPRLDALAERGPFVLLDVHSYNHRRDGADEPPAPDVGQPRGQRRHRQPRPRPLRSARRALHGRPARRVDSAAVRSTPARTSPSRAATSRGGCTTAIPGSGACWRWSSRRPSWTSGPASSTTTRLARRAGGPGGHAARAARRAGEAAVSEAASGAELSASPTSRSTTASPCCRRASASCSTSRRSTPTTCATTSSRAVEPDPASPTASSTPTPTSSAPSCDAIDLGAVEDPVLGQLLRAKHREMELQLDMLEARDTDDFLPLSVELYGGVSPDAAQAGRGAARRASPAPSRPTRRSTPRSSSPWPRTEIAHYRAEDPDLDMHAEIRPDVNGVMVSGDTLLIGPETKVQRARAQALLHHEVGTHLVTQANGSHQPIKVLGVGLAGYDETQEGLAVLAEIALRRADRLPAAPARQPRRHRAPDDRRRDVRRGPRGPGRGRLPRGQRVHHRDARLPLRRDDQGRDLPPRPRRAARAPRRRRLARPAVAGQVLPARPAAHRRPARTAACCARPGSCRATCTTRRPTPTWPARPGPRTSARSWKDTHEDRVRRQRHRDREGGVHHQPARHGGQGDGPRGVVHGHRRLRLRARRLAEHQGPRRRREVVPLPRAPPLRRPEARGRAAPRARASSTWSCCATTRPTTPRPTRGATTPASPSAS